MTDTYGVMGHPIAHSKSPYIHAAFARQTAQDMDYRAIHVQPGGFSRAVSGFRADGGRGLNVTLPFKEEAWALARERSVRSLRARSVNTLWFGEAGRIHGDNTDGVGLVRDLTLNQGVSLARRRILLLGAGGAARGVVVPLLKERPACLVIANRTVARAQSLAAACGDAGPVSGCGFEALLGRSFDVIINATAASLAGEVPPLPERILADGAWCYDLMYADQPTPFVRWGRAQGAAGSVDGLGMLVEQAAESFFIWRGVRPDTAPVIAELRGGREA